MQEHSDIIISERYHLLKRLRRGGMSEVFLAFDEQTQQQIAIKVVMDHDQDCIQRLQREVCILRKLSHPHILPLLDDGISGPYYYLVMPYMQRGNLRERLARGKMTQQEAASILHQLADALEYAHEQGIIHRDIKPSNILLDTTDANHVYLADFGIAKILQEGSDITQTGCLIGTPEYMAPELAEKPESVSSDIYAVGILLYQLLTGQLPFTGTNPIATYWKHIKEQPAKPSSLNPEISPAIEQVILRALNKDPRRRFPDAQAMSLAYANALNGSEVDHFLALSVNPTVDLPVLPPPSIVLRKVKMGFVALPASFWQNRVGKAMQRGILSLAALLLLALPISLGFIFAHNGSQVNQPLSISGAFASGKVTGKVLPAKQTTPTVNGGGQLPAQISTTSSHTPPQITWNASEGDEQGHAHGHGHGHGHKHHGD